MSQEPAPTPANGVQRILVVEDDPNLAVILKFNLESTGYRVDIARDGVDGLKRIWDERPDLVVLDIMMPRMDGWEVLESVRSDPSLRRLPVIILTNKREDESIARGWSAGADFYLTKPFEMADLLLVTKRILQAASSERA